MSDLNILVANSHNQCFYYRLHNLDIFLFIYCFLTNCSHRYFALSLFPSAAPVSLRLQTERNYEKGEPTFAESYCWAIGNLADPGGGYSGNQTELVELGKSVDLELIAMSII